MKHTLTPWIGYTEADDEIYIKGHSQDPTDCVAEIAIDEYKDEYQEEYRANFRRIVQCVNACAGLDDPEAALAAAREALELVEYKGRSHGGASMCLSCSCIPTMGECHDEECYIGKALQLLTPTP